MSFPFTSATLYGPDSSLSHPHGLLNSICISSYRVGTVATKPWLEVHKQIPHVLSYVTYRKMPAYSHRPSGLLRGDGGGSEGVVN